MSVTDKRVIKKIKACLNTVFENKSAQHADIAKCIAQYSHSSRVRYGTVFESRHQWFYIVQKVLSPFFARVTLIPPIRRFHFTEHLFYSTVPDWRNASEFHVKRIFDPFSRTPYLKCRGKTFFIQMDYCYLNKLRLFNEYLD